MDKITKNILLGLTATAMLGAGSARAAGIVLDSFEETTGGLQRVETGGLASVASISQQPAFGSNPFSEVLGGYRDVIVGDLVERIPGISAIDKVGAEVGSGMLYVDNSAILRGTVKVQWDGVTDNNPGELILNGLGGEDITNSGQLNAIKFNIDFTDGPIDLILDAYDMSGLQSQATIRVTGPVQNSEEMILFALNQTAFNNSPIANKALFQAVGGGSGANFADLGAMQLSVIPQAFGVDARIRVPSMVSIEQEPLDTPEPTLSLLGWLGLAGLGAASKLRQSKRGR
jgi:hypothetical protein